MPFKYLVGQTVAYTPVRGKVGLYRIVRQMPAEEQAYDLRYRIKSEAEIYERNVLECQLSPDIGAKGEYTASNPRLSKGSHGH